MAIFANTDAFVSINAVDLSSYVVSCEWVETMDTAETVAMSDTDVTVVPTFARGTFSVEFNQDFAASQVYATLTGVHDGAAAVAIAYRHTSGAIAATNPEMQTNAVLTSMPIISGSIGEIATITCQFVFDGTGVTRDVTP